MSDSLWPNGLQHTRLPCSSPSPRICPSSCLLSQRGHPTISSPATLFSFCLRSFPASGSFPVTQLFTSGGQSIGVSASVLPLSVQGWFSLGLTSLNPLLSKGLSIILSSTTAWKHQFFRAQPPCKTMALTIWTFVGKVKPFLFNMLSRFVLAFFSRSKCLPISWLQFDVR